MWASSWCAAWTSPPCRRSPAPGARPARRARRGALAPGSARACQPCMGYGPRGALRRTAPPFQHSTGLCRPASQCSVVLHAIMRTGQLLVYQPGAIATDIHIDGRLQAPRSNIDVTLSSLMTRAPGRAARASASARARTVREQVRETEVAARQQPDHGQLRAGARGQPAAPGAGRPAGRARHAGQGVTQPGAGAARLLAGRRQGRV